MYSNSVAQRCSIEAEDITEVLVGYNIADIYTWEDTPFRPSDDVVLLSFGFHYGSDGTTMYKVKLDGTTWSVTLDKGPVPQWYRNGKKIGGRSYDDVVNEFKK